MSQALATSNQTDQRESYCKLLIWWKSPDEIDDQELLRRIMNLGTIGIFAYRSPLSHQFPEIDFCMKPKR